MSPSFALSFDGQRFEPEQYPTREAAIAAAPDALDLLPGDPFWVGQVEPLRHGVVVEDVIDRISDNIFDVVPDCVEYSPLITEQARAEFNELLTAWLRKHGLHPDSFGFSVDTSEQHTAPSGGAEP